MYGLLKLGTLHALVGFPNANDNTWTTTIDCIEHSYQQVETCPN
jgi:hypothetical protein